MVKELVSKTKSPFVKGIFVGLMISGGMGGGYLYSNGAAHQGSNLDNQVSEIQADQKAIFQRITDMNERIEQIDKDLDRIEGLLIEGRIEVRR